MSEFFCDSPIHKGQEGVAMATNFGTKIAINAFLSEITFENMIPYTMAHGFSWSANPVKTFLIARHFHGNQILAKID